MEQITLQVPIAHERVRVNRCGQTIEAVTTHQLFAPVLRDGQLAGRGELLGIGIRDDRGFEMYAQMDQFEAV